MTSSRSFDPAKKQFYSSYAALNSPFLVPKFITKHFGRLHKEIIAPMTGARFIFFVGSYDRSRIPFYPQAPMMGAGLHFIFMETFKMNTASRNWRTYSGKTSRETCKNLNFPLQKIGSHEFLPTSQGSNHTEGNIFYPLFFVFIELRMFQYTHKQFQYDFLLCFYD